MEERAPSMEIMEAGVRPSWMEVSTPFLSTTAGMGAPVEGRVDSCTTVRVQPVVREGDLHLEAMLEALMAEAAEVPATVLRSSLTLPLHKTWPVT